MSRLQSSLATAHDKQNATALYCGVRIEENSINGVRATCLGCKVRYLQYSPLGKILNGTAIPALLWKGSIQKPGRRRSQNQEVFILIHVLVTNNRTQVTTYMRNPRSVILAVIPVDIATQEIVRNSTPKASELSESLPTRPRRQRSRARSHLERFSSGH